MLKKTKDLVSKTVVTKIQAFQKELAKLQKDQNKLLADFKKEIKKAKGKA